METNAEDRRVPVSVSIVIEIPIATDPVEVRRRLQQLAKAVKAAGLDVILQGVSP